MRFSVIAPVLLAGVAQAWRPEDRDLAAFNMTARFEQLGKRFKPRCALPRSGHEVTTTCYSELLQVAKFHWISTQRKSPSR